MQILRILGISLILHFGLGGAVALAGPDGRALYLEHCSACHQFEGQGGIGLPLLTGKLADVSDEYLSSTIRKMNFEEAIALSGFNVNNRPANPQAKVPSGEGDVQGLDLL